MKDNIWKFVATSLASLIVGFGISWGTSPHNVVTREELKGDMPGYVSQYSPYTEDQKEIAAHLQSIDKTLTIIQARQEQQASDIATIAAKAHVTAEPYARPQQ